MFGSPEYEPTPQPEQAALVELEYNLLELESFSKHALLALRQMGFDDKILARVDDERMSADRNYDYLERACVLQTGQMPTAGMVWQLVDYMRYDNGDGTGRFSESFTNEVIVPGGEEIINDLRSAGVEPVLLANGGSMMGRLKINTLQELTNLDLPWIIVNGNHQSQMGDFSRYIDKQRQPIDMSRYAQRAIASSRIIGNSNLDNIQELYLISADQDVAEVGRQIIRLV